MTRLTHGVRAVVLWTARASRLVDSMRVQAEADLQGERELTDRIRHHNSVARAILTQELRVLDQARAPQYAARRTKSRTANTWHLHPRALYRRLSRARAGCRRA